MPDASDTQPPHNSASSPGAGGAIFSPRQRRILGFSITLLAACVAVFLLLSILVLLARLIGAFSNVLWPVAIAGVLALILRPLVDLLEHRLFRGRRLAAVVVLYILFIGFMTTLAILAIPPLANQLVELLAYLPKFWTDASAYVQEHFPYWTQRLENLRANPTVASLYEELTKLPALILPSLKALGGGVFSAAVFTIHIVVFPIYLFFFLLSRSEPIDKIAAQLTFLKPTLRADVVFLIDEFIAIIVSFFRGQIIIGLSMGVLLAIGFWLCGLQFGVLFGIALGILNILPYIGTITGILVTLPLAFFQPNGGPLLVLKIALVYIAVQLIEAWLLTPKIMGDRTGLHPAVIIFAIFFWSTALGGMMGMLLAVPLTAFFVTFWRLVQRKYFARGN